MWGWWRRPAHAKRFTPLPADDGDKMAETIRAFATGQKRPDQGQYTLVKSLQFTARKLQQQLAGTAISKINDNAPITGGTQQLAHGA